MVKISWYQKMWKKLDKDVDHNQLMIHLSKLPDAFNCALTKTTSILTFTDAMNKSEIYIGMLCNVNKLLKPLNWYFTSLFTSTIAERSFIFTQNKNTLEKFNGTLQTVTCMVY